MHAEFSYAYFECLFIVQTHQCTVKSRIYEIKCTEKVGLFVNRPMALQIPEQKQYAHNGAPCSPIEQKCHIFKVFIMKITINYKEWSVKMCVENSASITF